MPQTCQILTQILEHSRAYVLSKDNHEARLRPDCQAPCAAFFGGLLRGTEADLIALVSYSLSRIGH